MSRIKELLVSFEEEALMAEVRKELDGGTEPTIILDECQEAMVEIGEMFDRKEMFVSDLMMAGTMFKDVSALVVPMLKKGDIATEGKVVLGTVYGDIHDIGKDIVNNMLTASGFEVIDLGVDINSRTWSLWSKLQTNGIKRRKYDYYWRKDKRYAQSC